MKIEELRKIAEARTTKHPLEIFAHPLGMVTLAFPSDQENLDFIKCASAHFDALLAIAEEAQKFCKKHIMPHGEMISCPDNKPGCLVAHFKTHPLVAALAALEAGV